MIFKLAARGVKRQIGNYLVYFVTVSIVIALTFAVNNLIFGDIISTLTEERSWVIRPSLIAVSAILSLVIAFILGYATSFLLRRRKREFGLYLTLGMTRMNIITIFVVETAITFLASLGAGAILGFAFYQILMIILANFIDMPYVFAGYSLQGIGLSILAIFIMFLIATVASLGYLKFTKIRSLLHGDKKTEKTVKPAEIIIWLILGALSVIGMICSVSGFREWTQMSDFFNHVDLLLTNIFIFLASVVVLPVAVCKTLMSLLLRVKPLKSRGTATFTMRQLSGRLTSNSTMMGVLTLLLTLAIILPSFMFTTNSVAEAEVGARYPYDISYWGNEGGLRMSYDEWLEVIESEAEIKSSVILNLYGEYGDYYMSESDFIKLCALWNYTPPALNGKKLSCDSPYSNKEFKYDAKNGHLKCPRGFFDGGSSNVLDNCTIVPDEDVNPKDYNNEKLFFVMLSGKRYNVRGLNDKLNPVYRNVDIKAYEILDSLSGYAMVMLGMLFVSVVFILMTIAMLALRILAMISEERMRYSALWKIGASYSVLFRSLIIQIFVYFFMPFVLPIVLCFPLAPFIISIGFAGDGEFALSAAQIYGQIFSFVALVLVLYALYFVITSFLAWRDVKKNIRAE